VTTPLFVSAVVMVSLPTCGEQKVLNGFFTDIDTREHQVNGLREEVEGLVASIPRTKSAFESLKSEQ
jgi:hypothetical protein